MNQKWKIAENKLAMMRAAGQIIQTGQPGKCPFCQKEIVRFYVHQWTIELGGQSTIWTWCSLCRQWEHISRLDLNLENHPDPLSETDANFGKMSQDWFNRLNDLWDKEMIPKTLPV